MIIYHHKSLFKVELTHHIFTHKALKLIYTWNSVESDIVHLPKSINYFNITNRNLGLVHIQT